MIPGHAMGVQKHTWSPFKSKNSSVRSILQTTPITHIWWIFGPISSKVICCAPALCCYDTRACYGSSKAYVISFQVQKLICKEHFTKQPPSNTSDAYFEDKGMGEGVVAVGWDAAAQAGIWYDALQCGYACAKGGRPWWCSSCWMRFSSTGWNAHLCEGHGQHWLDTWDGLVNAEAKNRFRGRHPSFAPLCI